MNLSLIAAVSKNGVIGGDNKLLWHISEDLKRFKKLTTGHPIIMGRKTFESIGRPLPNRENIVLTRDPNWTNEGVHTYLRIKDAIQFAADVDQEETFVIGGEQIYKLFFDQANKIYLTFVDKEFRGDAFFPEIDQKIWNLKETEDHFNEKENCKFQFQTFERI